VTIFANVFPDLELSDLELFRKKGLKFGEAPDRDDGCGSSFAEVKALSSQSATSRYFDLQIVRAHLRRKVFALLFPRLRFSVQVLVFPIPRCPDYPISRSCSSPW
jgi:hypothetical protein